MKLVLLSLVVLIPFVRAACDTPCMDNFCPFDWTCNAQTKCCEAPPTIAAPTTKGPTSCDDLGVNCKDLAYLCDDPKHSDVMHHNCPATCHVCDQPDPVTCEDDPKADCSAHFDKCFDPRYKDLMKKICPITCDLCPKPQGCKDVDANCPQWIKNGFCKKYSADIVKAKCPKSCNVC